MNIRKTTVGEAIGGLGLIGSILCGSSVIKWTLALGAPQNIVGAILIVVLMACASVACAHLFYMGRTKDGKFGFWDFK